MAWDSMQPHTNDVRLTPSVERTNMRLAQALAYVNEILTNFLTRLGLWNRWQLQDRRSLQFKIGVRIELVHFHAGMTD